FDYTESIEVQLDGKILAAIHFFDSEATFGAKTIRFNSDGVVDSAFRPTRLTNGSISTIAIAPDGKSILAGKFAGFAGSPCDSVVRLNVDGSVDSLFAPGAGISGWLGVSAMAIQPDGKVII